MGPGSARSLHGRLGDGIRTAGVGALVLFGACAAGEGIGRDQTPRTALVAGALDVVARTLAAAAAGGS